LFKAGAITQSQLEASKADLTAAESALNAARARLDQARAALQLASAELDNGLIVSPLDGVVTAININSGEIAAAGSQLLTVVNTDSLIVNAYMPSSLLNKINVGQQAVIKVAHIPDKVFKGQIYIIDSVMNSKNNKVLVKVRFADRDPLLKPGMFAEIGLNGVKESEGKTQ
jgi:RND family efflux transporter MFP subunit